MNSRVVTVFSWIAFALIMFISGCKPTVPSDIIPEGEMENILYDYHLAESMAQQDYEQYEINAMAYQTAVFRKYGITKADFDTSMVYYMRHTDRLHDIYKRVAARMEDKARTLGSSEGTLASLARVGLSTDTADIWKGDKTIALVPNKPYNLYSFSYTPDSSYHKGDSFILTMHSDFIFQDGIRDGLAMLALVFKNDSVASQVVHMSSSTLHNITLHDADTLGIKEVKGFFMLNKSKQDNASTSALHLMTLGNIHLLRCRKPNDKPKQLKVGDKIPDDSLRREPQRMRKSKQLERQDSTKKNPPIN